MNQKIHHKNTKDTKLSFLCALGAFVVNPKGGRDERRASPCQAQHRRGDGMAGPGGLKEGALTAYGLSLLKCGG
ncbi:hypothetical protein [uncultured Lamprocystis sp.]|jgi:hypothetical protein|uniref:hypothetical protein n=1 Tax=uncultured Lamprocystis sp. TaxID=543132 RepID=UPI0025E4D8B9|nr:hypothetical protein [uncultured Lamprocystis sp.]